MSYEELSVEDKMAKAFKNLYELRPFYASVYQSLKRVEDETVDTMGVTTNTLAYNPKFVNKLTFPQFMFTNMHEIGHVALMHVARRKHRDPLIWNLACDLYVNKLLSDEFNIVPGDTTSDGLVSFPLGLCFTTSIDIDNDYVEDIYDNLYKQGKENGYLDSKVSDFLDKKSYHFSYEGSAGKNKKNNFGSGYGNNSSSGKGKYDKFDIDIVPKYFYCDIRPYDGKDQATIDNETKQLLSEAAVRSSMHNAGLGSCKLAIQVAGFLKSHLDWRKLLKKYCIKATMADSSFSNPDKRMYYQSAIYPGQVQDENGMLKGVKICFDTSGSISDEDIMYFYGQVRDILKNYKVKAELICWDSDIESQGDFSDTSSLMRVEAKGRGGTDPTCVFKYFESKKCKIKPIVTLIFTDGYFYYDIDTKYKKKYNDTIWVMTRNYNKDFKPSFGKLAIARFSE
jgi:predicted metal-dependent peptidase